MLLELRHFGHWITTDHTLEPTTENLISALREAQQAADAKARFLANISHEIRTPMNGVLGMLELVADTQLDERQRHWINVARTSGDALLTIINEVLDFSKLEAGRAEVEELVFDPAVIANDVVSLLEPMARSKGLALTTALGPDVPAEVIGDPGRVRQVLLNLVGNAIKFTERGAVRLLVDRICSSADRGPTTGTLRFVVEDTGSGLPSHRLDDLFLPFHQLDASTTRTFGGTGLGLAICREMVRLMAGHLLATSDVGVGSAFAFTIPVRMVTKQVHAVPSNTVTPAETTTGVAIGPAGSASPHVLVAEDNAVNQLLIKAILDRIGATYEVVADGTEAVEAATQRPFTAILMDCQMPVLDGFGASRRIRATGSAVPILALTANALAGDRERCIDAGMTDYLAKPVKLDQLRAALARVCDLDAVRARQ